MFRCKASKASSAGTRELVTSATASPNSPDTRLSPDDGRREDLVDEPYVSFHGFAERREDACQAMERCTALETGRHEVRQHGGDRLHALRRLAVAPGQIHDELRQGAIIVIACRSR
jgi:hypothetical protein